MSDSKERRGDRPLDPADATTADATTADATTADATTADATTADATTATSPPAPISEAQLQEIQKRLWETLTDGYCLVDERGCYVHVSPSYVQLVGFSAAELLGESFLKIVPDELRPLYREAFQQTLRAPTGEETGLFQVQRGSGELIYLWTRHLMVEVEGRGLHAFTARDVTAQKRAEEDLLHDQRMQTLGRLAGGVAHEFNNLLVSIKGYAEILAERSAIPKEVARQYGRKILRAALRGTQLTSQLLPFSRREPQQKRQVDLHEVLRDALDLLRVSPGGDLLEIERHLAAREATVIGEATQLNQIFVNLFLNAKEAMAAGGLLRVTTENVQMRRRPTPVDIRLDHSTPIPISPSSFLLVTVSDTGTGMPQEVQERLAEPFFTTKDSGTGLGMALVFSAVESHGGWVEVESTPGQGSTIQLWLPQSREGAPPRANPPLAAE